MNDQVHRSGPPGLGQSGPSPAGRPGADCLASNDESANVTFPGGSRDLVLALI